MAYTFFLRCRQVKQPFLDRGTLRRNLVGNFAGSVWVATIVYRKAALCHTLGGGREIVKRSWIVYAGRLDHGASFR